MTEQQLQHAAEVLLNSKKLTGGDEPKFLPKIFVVNGECYWFLNVARRAAYGTNYPIEVMTIEEAWNIHIHIPADTLDKKEVEEGFDQTGETFDGFLFEKGSTIYAGMVPNPVIQAQTGKADPLSNLDMMVNKKFIGVRTQNIMLRQGLKTYRDLILFGRKPLLQVRNCGRMVISELDAEMERMGLGNFWKFNKPLKQTAI